MDASTGNVLHEGDRLRTDGAAQVTMQFFDDTSLTVFGNTEVQLTKAQSSRFNRDHTTLEITLVRGKVEVDVPRSLDMGEVRIWLPYGSTTPLNPGSYAIRVGPNSQVRVHQGDAEVFTTAYDMYHLNAGERMELNPTGVVGPLVATEELVTNGDFSDGMTGWALEQAAGFPEGGDIVGYASLVEDENRKTVGFSRLGSGNYHFGTQLTQKINMDVSEYHNLRLSLSFVIHYQSLSGGGYLGSEYPLRVRVDYQTADSEAFVVYGFYYQNTAKNRTDHGVEVQKDTWVNYTAPINLMTLLPRPQRIQSIEISASGWDLESRIGSVSLAAR